MIRAAFRKGTLTLPPPPRAHTHTHTYPHIPPPITTAPRIFSCRISGFKVYFMGGRVAMTVQIPTSAYSVTVMASEAAPLITANSWQMGSIWVTKDEVLATPRLDGKN